MDRSDGLVTSAAAAGRLRVTPARVHQLAAAGRLPVAVRHARLLLVRPADGARLAADRAAHRPRRRPAGEVASDGR